MNARARPVFTTVVYAWGAALLVFHAVLSLLLLPWMLLADRDRRASARLGSALVRASLRVPPCWRPASRGIASVDLGRPAVVVMNHRSIADVAIAVALPGGPPLAAKPWVGRVPLLGACLRLAGHLVFDPADIGQVRDFLDRAESLVRGGVSVVFFPEGTRQAGEGLGTFEAGAFEVAVRAGADVLPVVVTGSGDLVPRGSILFHHASVLVTPLDRIPPGTDRRALAARVREAMLTALAAPPRA